MESDELRRHILADHRTIRGLLASIEKLAEELVSEERPLLGPLREEGEALFTRLRAHMRWEEDNLRPALIAAGAWGRECAERLDQDHRRQRRLLFAELESLRDQTRPAMMIARGLLGIVKDLRADMDEEEAQLLDVVDASP